MSKRGTWHATGRGYARLLVGVDLYLDSDPVESLTMLLTETWRSVDVQHCGLDSRRVDTL